MEIWIILTLASAFFFSIRLIAEKRAVRDENSLDFLYTYTVVKFILLIPFIFVVGLAPINVIIASTIAAVVTLIMFYMMFKVLKRIEVSTLAPLLNLTPLFALFTAFIVLGEFPAPMQLLGVGFTILGVYVLIVKSPNNLLQLHHKMKSKYMVLAVIVAFMFSIAGIVQRYNMRYVTWIESYFYVALLQTIGIIIMQGLLRNLSNIKATIKRSGKFVLIAAVVTMITNMLSVYALSFPGALVALVIPIRRTSTLFTVILAGKFFKEGDMTRKIAASILMLIGVFIIAQT